MKVLLASFLMVLPLHAEENLLTTLRPGHPRIILTPEKLESLKKTVATDETAKGYHAKLAQDAESFLKGTPVDYSLENKKLLNESRSVLKRVSTLAALHRIDGDPRYLARAKRELLEVAKFPDWNPDSFLSTAEMTLAFAIGYDWLYDQLTPEERTVIRSAIVEKGLKPGLKVYQSKKGWPHVTHNWNAVCNNGLVAGALAVADTDAEISNAILNAAKASLPKGYRDYAPDGGWPEGPGYWAYGTGYAIYGLASLDSALGTDWNLSASPGFSETGNFRIDMAAPSGMNFNFADAGVNTGPSSCMFWLANRFNKPEFDAAERIVAADEPSIFHLVFFNPKLSTPAATAALEKRPLSRLFSGVNVAVLRSASDKSGTYLAIKGGSNKVNHGHLDLGTFVLENGGMRFAEELGPDNYTLPGYFGANRWDYYRTRTEGQNTLTIGGENQGREGKAEVFSFSDDKAKPFAVINLTDAYAPNASKVLRGVSLDEKGRVLLQDEIQLKEGAAVTWTMHTMAKVTTDAGTATLSRGKKTMKAEIVSPKGAVFALNEVTLQDPQRGTPNTRKLTISLPNDTRNVLVAVRFTPGDEETLTEPLLPVSAWKR